MDTKLTLKLNEDVIQRAKAYAAKKQLSLSRIIENYLSNLTSEKDTDLEISPFVKSIVSGKSVTLKADKQDYRDYLEKKYQ